MLIGVFEAFVFLYFGVKVLKYISQSSESFGSKDIQKLVILQKKQQKTTTTNKKTKKQTKKQKKKKEKKRKNNYV